MLIAPFNDLETTRAIVEERHEDIAGIIAEPFQRLIPPRPGFLEGLRELADEFGIPLIFDEVVTGFRFAYGGAQEFYGVTPRHLHAGQGGRGRNSRLRRSPAARTSCRTWTAAILPPRTSCRR